MKMTRLVFKSVSEIVDSAMCLIVLTDQEEARQITIVCDSHTKYQLGLRIAGVPVAEKLLPEVLLKFMIPYVDGMEIIIHNVTDGQYNAVLRNGNTSVAAPIRISDAVLLSYISKIPLYIDNELMKLQSVPYCSGKQGLSVPVNTISNDMLKDALSKAIKCENYELASQLRNEQIRRQKTDKSPKTDIE